MLDPLPFATYSFVMSITPGPNNVMLTASGATFGFRRTVPHMLGINAGHAVQILGVCMGLGALFERWPALQTTLKWLGAAYLLYLGWNLLRAGETQAKRSARPLTFMEGALFQFLNPKAWVMSLTATAMFFPSDVGLFWATVYVVAVAALVNLPCIAVWALFGSSLRNWLSVPARRTVFNAVMALALAGTGVIMVT